MTCSGYPTSISYQSNYNPFWNIIITFTTVGYGDIFPSTHFGRLMSMTSMFFGQFVISLILIAMSISAEFTLAERRAFKDFRDIEYFHKRAMLAGDILSTYTLMSFCKSQVQRDANKAHQGDDDDVAEDNAKQLDNTKLDGTPREVGGKRNAIFTKNENKVFKFTRFAKIGNLRGYQQLDIQYHTLAREFKQLNS